MKMNRWNMKKITAFILALVLLLGTSFDGNLGMGIRAWADPLSPENAITFISDISSVEKILFINNEHYVIAWNTSDKLGIYKLDIAAKALSRLCNVSNIISGVDSFEHYTKVGANHRFMFSLSDGESPDEYTKVYTITSPDMKSFSLAKPTPLTIEYAYSCSLSFNEADGYYFINAELTMARKGEKYEGYVEKYFRLYTSRDCVNWRDTGIEIWDEGDYSVNIDYGQAIGSDNEIVVLTEGYDKYVEDGEEDHHWEYELYLASEDHDGLEDWTDEGVYREDEDENWRLYDDERIDINDEGWFTYVFYDDLYLKNKKYKTTYVDDRDIYLYYGINELYCGEAERLDSESTKLTYFDNGIYSERIGTHGKYLYYRYTPNPKLPVGTYKVNVITGGTSISDKTILSLTDYADSTYFSTPTAIYMRITHNNGSITFHRLQNGAAATITEAQYNSALATTLLLQPPITEYRELGYEQCYVDTEKAIFFNDDNHSFKIIYKNSAPTINVTAPAHNSIFGPQHTAIIPQISVSDPDNNALTCKYYMDGAEKETRNIASNTSTPQTVSFTAINMGTLSEGSHEMRFTVTDNFLTVEAIVNFKVDKTPPAISSLTATSTENKITVNASVSDTVAGLGDETYPPYRYTITDGTSTYQSIWKTQSTHTQSSLQPNKNYTVKLEARDKVGNTAQKSIATVYTKAQKPSLTTGNAAETAMDIVVSDSNPASTQYQIMMGTKYISSAGALTTAPQWITLTNKKIRANGLTPNTTYSITAKARNGANEETPSSAAAYGTTLPLAPENITAQPEQYSITLTWSAMPNITRYEVSADGQVESNGTSTTYIHDGLEPNTQHNYKVRAVNAGGTGAWSNTLTAVTLPDPPGIPANLRAIASQREVILAWDEVEDAATYDIEANGEKVGSTAALTYTHTGLQPDTQYTYRVRAVNRGGEGEWCDRLYVDTLPDPPELPGGFEIEDRTKDTITLKWNKADRAEAYDIEADGAIIDSATETTYVHAGLAPDTEHIYRIRARNRGGASEWTAEVIIRTLPEKPSIPNNLTATAGTNEIILSWDAAERAEEYDIEADGEVIATITDTSYTHDGLTSDTKHTYRVKARNIGGESDYSAMVTAYTLSDTTGMVLANVAAVVTNTSITLMWDAVAADTEYDVEVDGEIKDNGKNTMYIHSGLQPVTSHTYKIRPRKGEEIGPWCAVLAISTLPNAPDAPDNIRAIVTNTTIQLVWDPEDGATGYDIEIDGGPVESTTDTTFIHKDLIPGTEHSYRIRAKNIGGAAAWSEAIVKSTIKPTYMIEAEAGEEYHIALTAMGMQEFSGKNVILKYNPEEAEIIDLCEATREIELENGKIPGTGIDISHENGTIVLEMDKQIEPGKAWTGVMNTILIRAKVDGQISLDYIVE
jgi:hypothetical protein